MEKKVLILGSNGMAGHVISRKLIDEGFEVTKVAGLNADYNVNFEKENEFTFLLNKMKYYDFVINCVGCLVDESKQNPDRATFLNTKLPKLIESKLRAVDTKIIHLSTDCVFSGKTNEFYTEESVPDEVEAYGATKAAGEINNNKDITFRLSYVGPEIKNNGTGLLHWFLTNNSSFINGYSDHLWSGITTLELARVICCYIKNPEVTGIINLVNNDFSCSKYDLLFMFRKYFKKNIVLKKLESGIPKNKILRTNKLPKYLSVNTFDMQLRNLGEFMNNSDYPYS